MTKRLTRLDVGIEADSDADPAESATLAMGLCEWLLVLDIESAGPATSGQAPPRTRSGGMFVAGALTVMLTQSPELFGKLIDTVWTWLSHSGARSVKLEIDGDVLEVTGISREDQRELIRAWIDRHTDR